MDHTNEDLARMEDTKLRRICVLDYCDRETISPGSVLCRGHYQQQYRGQRLTPFRKPITQDDCEIEGCDTPRKGRYCPKHKYRIARHGDPHKIVNPRDEEPSYVACHKRLRRSLGPASSHQCSMGCGKQAKEWAYVGPRKRNDRLPFSENDSFYSPLCKVCHAGFDGGFRQTGPVWRKQAIDYYQSGLSCKQIACIFETNTTAVWRALVKSAVEMR